MVIGQYDKEELSPIVRAAPSTHGLRSPTSLPMRYVRECTSWIQYNPQQDTIYYCQHTTIVSPFEFWKGLKDAIFSLRYRTTAHISAVHIIIMCGMKKIVMIKGG